MTDSDMISLLHVSFVSFKRTYLICLTISIAVTITNVLISTNVIVLERISDVRLFKHRAVRNSLSRCRVSGKNEKKNYKDAEDRE